MYYFYINNQEDKNQSGVLPATEESNCNGDGLVNDSSNGESDSGNLKSFDDGSQPVIPEFEKDSELFSRQVSAEILVEMEKASGCGNCPGNILRLLKQINTPSLDWRVLLRQFLRECRGGSYKWLPPNRRFVSKGLYLPGRSQHIFRGIIALDTSGDRKSVV